MPARRPCRLPTAHTLAALSRLRALDLEDCPPETRDPEEIDTTLAEAVGSLRPHTQLTRLTLSLHYPRIGATELPALEDAVAGLTQLRCIRVLDLALVPPGEWMARLERAVLPLWMYPGAGPCWHPEDLQEAAGQLRWLGLLGLDDGYDHERFLLCLLSSRPPRLRHLCIDAPTERFPQVVELAGQVGVEFACLPNVWDACIEVAGAGVADAGVAGADVSTNRCGRSC